MAYFFTQWTLKPQRSSEAIQFGTLDLISISKTLKKMILKHFMQYIKAAVTLGSDSPSSVRRSRALSQNTNCMQGRAGPRNKSARWARGTVAPPNWGRHIALLRQGAPSQKAQSYQTPPDSVKANDSWAPLTRGRHRDWWNCPLGGWGAKNQPRNMSPVTYGHEFRQELGAKR